jgi:hypothetical protein
VGRQRTSARAEIEFHGLILGLGKSGAHYNPRQGCQTTGLDIQSFGPIY